jgi:thioredoxin reductase
MATDYDLLVIGAGTGGYVAAIRAAQLGLREEVARGRAESAAALQAMRAEVEASGRTLRDALLSGMGELTRLHQPQLDTIVGRLGASPESQARRLGEVRVTVEQQYAANIATCRDGHGPDRT